MSVALLNDYFQIVANLVTILGLPLAIFIFYQEKQRERRDREYGTYNALDDKYIAFLEQCLEKPDLNVFDFDLPRDSSADDESWRKSRQEQILFTILISILERAFLMYQDQDTEVKERQYKGWVGYMEDYCKRENFRRLWPQLGPQFDTGFVEFMNGLVERTRPEKAVSQKAGAESG